MDSFLLMAMINHDIYIKRLIYVSDVTCENELHTHIYTFERLVLMLCIIRQLKIQQIIKRVDEQVVMVSHILAHHEINLWAGPCFVIRSTNVLTNSLR